MKYPRGLTHLEIIKRLQRAGWSVVASHGTHFILKHEDSNRRLTVPFKYDTPAGALHSILKKAGLTLVEFERLKK